jgi:hypothetical protein
MTRLHEASEPLLFQELDVLSKVRGAVQRLPSRISEERAFWRADGCHVFGRFQDQTITSQFIPIQSLEDGEVFGHAASTLNENLLPVELKFDALDSNTFIACDRLLRALHTLNYFGVSRAPVRLFLDVNQRFFTSIVDNHGKAFRMVIESLGLSPQHFVIQVLPNQNTDLSTFAFAADNYRRNGFFTGLYAYTAAQAKALMTQIRPDFLSLCLNGHWSVEQLPELVECAEQYHVRLVAAGQSIGPADLQRAGVILARGEGAD